MIESSQERSAQRMRETMHWRCDLCGCTGSSTHKSPIGVGEEAELLLALHRSVAPNCDGGALTIRVSLKGPIRE